MTYFSPEVSLYARHWSRYVLSARFINGQKSHIIHLLDLNINRKYTNAELFYNWCYQCFCIEQLIKSSAINQLFVYILC